MVSEIDQGDRDSSQYPGGVTEKDEENSDEFNNLGFLE